ncbi:MAG TPA: exopolysaccharide biosynthesis polyprenyl glycosylphosphotransferase, partial [Dermatophilaceae bacterium]|nr:exopolysaccharide biosynthesis polyprenyl glycosylphosphotransferase [Dermatophilaceae bacterium]
EIPTPRQASNAVASRDGGELFHRVPVVPIWRVTLLDGAAGLLGLLAGTLLWGGHAWGGVVGPIAIWLVALWSAGGYRGTLHGTEVTSVRIVLRAGLGVCAGVALVSIVVPAVDVRFWAGTSVIVLGVTLVARHLWAEALVGDARGSAVTVLARGRAQDVEAFLDCLDDENGRKFRATAIQVTDGALPGRFDQCDLEVIPASADVVDAASRATVGSVVLVGAQQESSEELRRMIWRLEGLGVGLHLVPVVAGVAQPRASTLHRTGIPVLAFTHRDLGAEVGVMKVIIDKVLALAALVVLLPVIAATTLAVKATSEGPVFFRQVRVGLRGREFEMLKFRTMYLDAEDRRAELEELNRHNGGTLFKIADDPRVTSAGRFLRRYSLDEVPQLINVFRGEMSLVGPRPPLPGEVANYPLDAHRRFCVRPGLTGLWQVSGRSDLGPQESVRLDAHYVEQWSPAMDMAILARTPRAVISGEGAY